MKLRRLFFVTSLALSFLAVGIYAAPAEPGAATKSATSSKKVGSSKKATAKASSAKGSKAKSTTPRKTKAAKPAPSKAKPKPYTNVDGKRVQSPTRSMTVPKGASARCGDGSYSFSAHRKGTCSHHGGVSSWLK
jgi:hypothetical protein